MMEKNIKDNVRTILSITLFVLFFSILEKDINVWGYAFGIVYGAISLSIFDILILKPSNDTINVLRSKIWDFFLYFSLITLAADFGLKLSIYDLQGFIPGVFFGFMLFNSFNYKDKNYISKLYNEIYHRIFQKTK